jgi:hypothetical protein
LLFLSFLSSSALWLLLAALAPESPLVSEYLAVLEDPEDLKSLQRPLVVRGQSQYT